MKITAATSSTGGDQAARTARRQGARPLIRHLEERLGVKLGGRTADGQFQIEGAECLGACGMGPCLQLGTHLYENVTPAKADALLESLRRGIVPRADTDREGVD